MTNPIGRISDGANPTIATSTNQSNVHSGDSKSILKIDSYLNLVDNTSLRLDLVQGSGNTHPLQSQEIRSRIIENAVNETIENPNHPYYSIGSQQREQMRHWIIEQLGSSHYLRRA
jgi:hypothetical protein